MTASSAPELRRLAALVVELRTRLDAALDAGDADGADGAEDLRGELALLEDLALPEAVSELRLQRLSYLATYQAMVRPLPASLVSFLA